MIETFLALLTAHLLADFPFQTRRLIENKRKPHILVLHITIIALVTVIILGAWPPLLLLILCGTHLLMDAVKIYLLKEKHWAFYLDQGIHLLVIVLLAYLFPESFQGGYWPDLMGPFPFIYLILLCVISGVILSLSVGNVIIALETKRFRDEMTSPIEGLTQGGAFIGQLERALVMLFVVTGYPVAVGFLVAAKSILRFGEVKSTPDRQMAEYVIIGTFMSVGWGLLIAVLTKTVLTYYLQYQ
ncbi:DUF3307 domain-containing protein [Litorimonas sp.]|uniref:DUF3307 domain-containing protein n=1 Tax=Litorimonas sp. TaxID=1892381 RepID=UPI003A86A8A4